MAPLRTLPPLTRLGFNFRFLTRRLRGGLTASRPSGYPQSQANSTGKVQRSSSSDNLESVFIRDDPWFDLLRVLCVSVVIRFLIPQRLAGLQRVLDAFLRLAFAA